MGVRYETLWKHTGAGCRVRVAANSVAWPHWIARFPACQRVRTSSSRRYHMKAVDGERMAERVQTHGCRPAPACPGTAPTRQGPGGHVVVERATALRHEDVLAETNRSAPVYGSFRAGGSWS